MKKANIIFKKNTPFSLDFNDFYFNSQDPIKESKNIYTHAFKFTKQSFTIAETGFGLGLNFFLTLQRFFTSKTKTRNLFYVAVEKFYIDKDEFKQIYKKLKLYKEFKEYLDEFLKFYPRAKRGIYRIYFFNKTREKTCFLDLVFDDISVLSDLYFKADIWYLDGFSPSKNEEIFNKTCIKEIKKLSRKNTQILSFSSSSLLQKNLKKYDFLVEKRKALFKRENLKAILQKEEKLALNGYFLHKSKKNKTNKVAIIGAGIASAVLAYELSLRGFEVDVFEENANFNNASFNQSAILSSLILKPNVTLGEFSQLALNQASNFYKKILKLKIKGALEFTNDKTKIETCKNNPNLSLSKSAILLKDATSINPRFIVKKLFKLSKAKIYFKHKFISYKYQNGLYSLNFTDSTKANYSNLIYATGSKSQELLNYKFLKLSKVRGQISILEPFLKNALCFSSKGYICCARKNFQVIGASYDRLNSSKKAQKQDDLENIKNIQEFIQTKPKLKGSRVSFRSYSSDRFIISGIAYNQKYYLKTYKKLFWLKNKSLELAPNQGLYLNLAHGSRGFSTAVLSARYICALINNEPSGLYTSFTNAINPSRFLVRKLKKALI